MDVYFNDYRTSIYYAILYDGKMSRLSDIFASSHFNFPLTGRFSLLPVSTPACFFPPCPRPPPLPSPPPPPSLLAFVKFYLLCSLLTYTVHHTLFYSLFPCHSSPSLLSASISFLFLLPRFLRLARI